MCQGLGEKLEVDPKLVIPNYNLTLEEGAIFPWAHASHKLGRQGYFWQELMALSEKHKFSLDVPVKELSAKIIETLMHGEEGFEGVVPNLERRYHETDSDWTRQEIEQYMVEKDCEVCHGKRLKPEVLAVTIAGKSIDGVVTMPLAKVQEFFTGLKLKDDELKIAGPVIKEILNRLQFLLDVGLDYLTLDRRSSTLSGGEEQRIRLATQIGSKLTGVLYILDEPSIGLHPRDQQKLIETLKTLRDLGNSVIVVEHDSQTMMQADQIIDVGPGAGKFGGKIIFQGTPKEILKASTLTGEYLSGRKTIECLPSPKLSSQKYLAIKGAKEHNLKNVDVKIPLGKLVCVSGVSGSGKSSLVNDILAKALLRKFYRAKDEPGKHDKIIGTEHINKIVLVDQSPIGRTPRSNPCTYTGAFAYIRDLFTKTKEARIRGYGAGRFSFNVKGGRCEACEGQGLKKIEMYFLPDVYVECQECKGKRFNKETLAVEYKGKNISDVLEMTVEEGAEFFKSIPALADRLKTLNSVGLGYIHLGQPAPSLSGGEAQRVKLATELARKASGKSLYILDEPTTGLHFDDVRRLIQVLRGLVQKGNTVLVIEHNSDVIKCADWIIDLGPEGGDKGGYIVGEGTPKEIMKNKKSYTGQFLLK
jgi:excinuclease ABC subunit A